MTSWALLALLDILPAGHESIRRGFDWLVAQQLENGDWPRQAVNGVFFGAAMLDYRLYPTYFPAWALARYVRLRTDRADWPVTSLAEEANTPFEMFSSEEAELDIDAGAEGSRFSDKLIVNS